MGGSGGREKLFSREKKFPVPFSRKAAHFGDSIHSILSIPCPLRLPGVRPFPRAYRRWSRRQSRFRGRSSAFSSVRVLGPALSSNTGRVPSARGSLICHWTKLSPLPPVPGMSRTPIFLPLTVRVRRVSAAEAARRRRVKRPGRAASQRQVSAGYDRYVFTSIAVFVADRLQKDLIMPKMRSKAAY